MYRTTTILLQVFFVVLYSFPWRGDAASPLLYHKNMAPLLALDLGLRRTGVAFGDDEKFMIIALDTIAHKTTDELIAALGPIITARKVSRLIVGLPRLLDGSEGKQANIVREMAQTIEAKLSLPIEFIDERYTTNSVKKMTGDPDAQSACVLLEIALDRIAQRDVDKS